MKNIDLFKKVKELRQRRGLSQEQLADDAKLSLRTLKRIEKGENVPRGDTLKMLAIALQVSPDEIIDWQVQEDRNVLTMLNLSQLGFLAFPILGVVMPLALWIHQKEKVKDVNEVGIAILNFQITWSLLLFFVWVFIKSAQIADIIVYWIAGFYLFNILFVFINTIRCFKKKSIYYKPAFNFLR